MEMRSRLNELASNLYWTWHPDVIRIFSDMFVFYPCSELFDQVKSLCK